MLGLSALSLLVAARFAAAGCSTYTYTACEDNIVHWYDPGTGEVCDPLPCGGGRAPVRYDVPGCDAYRGTEIYTPTTSYLSCFTPAGALLEPTAAVTDTTVDVEEPEPTSEPESTEETESVDAPATETPAPTTSASEDEDAEEETTFVTTSTSIASFTTTTTTTPITTSTTSTTTTPTSTGTSTETPPSTTTTEDADDAEPSNAAKVLDGSWIAAAGAAIGAIAML